MPLGASKAGLLGAAGSAGFSASGGTETTYTSGGVDYKVHSFTSTGNTNFVVSGRTDETVDILVVAGGGGGGASG